jgi:chemotaxis signal transduction protein
MSAVGATAYGPVDGATDPGTQFVFVADASGDQVLVFKVGGESFAIAVSAIEAVTEMPALRQLPAMPPHMLGMSELRGSLVAVYSPAGALNVGPDEPHAVIVAWAGRGAGRAGRRVAIAITEAAGVMAFEPTVWRGVGGAAARDGLVLGVAARGTTVTTLIDADAFLAACTSSAALEEA